MALARECAWGAAARVRERWVPRLSALPVRLEKEWLELCDQEVNVVGGELGVYEIGDTTGATLYIGYAGGNATYGLRGELRRQLDAHVGGGRRFRYEINMQYMSRWQELLMVHQSDHACLPTMQGSDRPARLGRLDPGSR